LLIDHRHRAPPRLLEPRPVSRQLCKGVSSLYCGYIQKPQKVPYCTTRHIRATSSRNCDSIP
jgi:hypothetical protein